MVISGTSKFYKFVEDVLKFAVLFKFNLITSSCPLILKSGLASGLKWNDPLLFLLIE